ncbi:unnamed protein product [Adineta steineri]|uniref:Uncharacterized protein n=1 Tax=Adineta steineri TaxID=433720 RepID=A0A819B2L8_9BILA|nr:unnamed protein product [Adineta steineri]CAF3796507.1 unnamed protein product [Adineta steineri]
MHRPQQQQQQLFFSKLLSQNTMENINNAVDDDDDDHDDEINTIQDEQNNNPQQQSIQQEIQPLKCSNPIVNRLSLLPAYPTFDRFGPINRDHLLLANISSRNLTNEQRQRRIHHPFHQPFTLTNENLTDRFQIDNAILDYNYERLRTCVNIMTQERIRYGLLSVDTIGMRELRIVEHALAMEFYLQIDDVLIRGRQNQPVVQFLSAQKHRFINDYETILNCPATCTTKNILYALTCPCGQYDYIGYTSLTLDEQLKYHREHGNRIMHEFILGSEKSTQIQQQTKSQEKLIADTMLIYKHSIRCPSAIQLFLDCNPQYWHFVPMLKVEIQDSSTNTLSSMPSDNYTFFAHQRLKQVQLLKDKHECLKPNFHLDLYNATIIAVVPDGCTALFYRLIEALFITHAQTKLNTLGHLDGMIVENNNSNDINARLVSVGQEYNWCQNLVRRPIILHEKTRTLTSHRINPHFQ